MSPRHNFAYRLPVGPWPGGVDVCFFTLFDGSFVLQLVYGWHVVQNTADLVVEHHAHENHEEDAQEESEPTEEYGSTLHKHKAVLIEAAIGLHSYQNDCMEASKEDIDQEQDKVLLIIIPNAVVDPRAVVVHPGYASVASWAVMALRHFYGVTLSALLRKNWF